MVRWKDRIRVPLLGALRTDPFEKLNEHAKMVKVCTESMKHAMKAYFEGDFDTFDKYRLKVIKDEEKADIIKRNIRNHLPKSIHMSVDKRNFLLLLTQQDNILDYEEDLVQWLHMRIRTYDNDISADFMQLTDKVIETIGYFEQAIFNLPDVLESSFADDERNETKKYIKKVSLGEHESDVLEQALSKKIFSLEDQLTPIDIYHLLRAVQILGEISNHAENASDRVRNLLAR
ncbi:MAG: TIGR00153 family protein [Candidatus Methanofastidiosia archaeon]